MCKKATLDSKFWSGVISLTESLSKCHRIYRSWFWIWSATVSAIKTFSRCGPPAKTWRGLWIENSSQGFVRLKLFVSSSAVLHEQTYWLPALLLLEKFNHLLECFRQLSHLEIKEVFHIQGKLKLQELRAYWQNIIFNIFPISHFAMKFSFIKNSCVSKADNQITRNEFLSGLYIKSKKWCLINCSTTLHLFLFTIRKENLTGRGSPRFEEHRTIL